MRKIALIAILATGCANVTGIKPIYSSNADGRVDIKQEGENLRFEFETKQCLAGGIPLTRLSTVTFPKDTICGESTAATVAGWLGKGIGDILQGIIKGVAK